MNKIPEKSRLNGRICNVCKNHVILHEQPFCKKITPNFDGNICKNFEYEEKQKTYKQITIEDLTNQK